VFLTGIGPLMYNLSGCAGGGHTCSAHGDHVANGLHVSGSHAAFQLLKDPDIHWQQDSMCHGWRAASTLLRHVACTHAVVISDTVIQMGFFMCANRYRSVAYRMELQAALRSLPVPASPAAALPEEAASSVPLNSSSGMQVASTGAATSALLQVPPTPPPSPEPIIDVSLSSLAASLTETGSGSDTEASSGSDTSSSGAGSVQLSAVARWSDSEEAYAPGVQTTRVEGEVCRWHLEKGVSGGDSQCRIWQGIWQCLLLCIHATGKLLYKTPCGSHEIHEL
jgi:hypothetical protein